jgi:microcystin-dependent protein
MPEPFIGQIAAFPYDFAPLGWMECAGQLLPINQYAALFSLLGTNFGGDGTRTFGLPDLQGRAAISQGTAAGGSPYAIGDKGGVETVALVASNVPTHSHALQAATVLGTTNSPTGAVLATVAKGPPRSRDQGQIYNTGTANTKLVPGSIGTAGGNGQAHDNVQPLLTLRYCIALNGMFPPRQ